MRNPNITIYPIHKQVITHLPSIWLNFQQPPKKKNWSSPSSPRPFPSQAAKDSGISPASVHPCYTPYRRTWNPKRSFSFISKHFRRQVPKKNWRLGVFMVFGMCFSWFLLWIISKNHMKYMKFFRNKNKKHHAKVHLLHVQLAPGICLIMMSFRCGSLGPFFGTAPERGGTSMARQVTLGGRKKKPFPKWLGKQRWKQHTIPSLRIIPGLVSS